MVGGQLDRFYEGESNRASAIHEAYSALSGDDGPVLSDEYGDSSEMDSGTAEALREFGVW